MGHSDGGITNTPWLFWVLSWSFFRRMPPIHFAVIFRSYYSPCRSLNQLLISLTDSRLA